MFHRALPNRVEQAISQVINLLPKKVSLGLKCLKVYFSINISSDKSIKQCLV